MKIDPVTLLFSDFTQDEAREMYAWARAVQHGPCPPLDWASLPPWMNLWMEVGGYGERQALLVISSVVPSRIFLSLLDANQDYIPFMGHYG